MTCLTNFHKKCFFLTFTLLVSFCVLPFFFDLRLLTALRESETMKAGKIEVKPRNLIADYKRIIDGDSKEISRVKEEMKKHLKHASNTEFKPKNLTADCKRIIDGDGKEISRVKQEMKKHPKQAITCEDYINKSKDCKNFQKRRRYILRALQKDEDFPIAFSVMIYKDIEQFERLLRAIYRPQNYYCIHVDRKSPEIFHRAVKMISACFPNVFLASTFVDVRWGEFSVLEADLICMRDLWRRYKNWKYFINLTGQEFPLRTNNELVEILRSLNGESIIQGSKPTVR